MPLDIPVLYGSQTGNCEAISERLVEGGKELGFSLHSMTMNKFYTGLNKGITSLVDHPLVIFVISSTGNGEAPDNASRFVRWAKKKSHAPDSLKGVRFTLLGLGDSNYDNYMGAPRLLLRRLLEMGASTFYACGEADEERGLEEFVEPWIDGLWKVLPRLQRSIPLPKMDELVLPPSPFTARHSSSSNELAGSPPPSIGAPSKTAPIKKLSKQDIVAQIVERCRSGRVDGSDGDTSSTGETSENEMVERMSPVLQRKLTKKTKSSTKKKAKAKTPQKGKSSESSSARALISAKKLASSDMLAARRRRGTGSKKNSKKGNSLDEVATKKRTIKIRQGAVTRLKSKTFGYEFISYERYSSISSAESCKAALQSAFSNSLYSDFDPLEAQCVAARLLVNTEEKEVWEVTLDVGDDNVSWTPGDAIALVSRSGIEDEEIYKLLQRLHIDIPPEDEERKYVAVLPVSQDNSLPGYLRKADTLYDMIRRFDLRSSPTRTLLRMVAEYCTDEAEKKRAIQLCQRSASTEFRALSTSLSIMELLEEFPSSMPPLDHLLSTIPRCRPRYFSVASSPLCHPSHVSIVFKVSRWNARPWGSYGPRPREGLVTGHLARMCRKRLGAMMMIMAEEDEENGDDAAGPQREAIIPTGCLMGGDIDPFPVQLFFRPSNEFRLPPPSEYHRPLLMVGPGTGVAPFVGFLQHRLYAKERDGLTCGPCMLFFGCQHEEVDFIYRKEMKEFEAAGAVDQVVCAFSRDGPSVVYVQHRMMEMAEQIYEYLIDQMGYLYVCGDARSMSRDVIAALEKIFAEYGDMDAEEAHELRKKLTEEKRILIDVWA